MKTDSGSIVKVKTYSGYKADERPISFSIGNLNIEIINIIDRWIDPECDYFRVRGEDGKAYTMIHNRDRDAWHMKAPSINL